MCDAIKLVETIDSCVPWDERQCKLSPGTKIKAMIINILSGRSPLYTVNKYYEKMDVTSLFGKGVSSSDFKDHNTPLGWGGLAVPFMFFVLPYQALSMELYHRGLSSRWLFPYWVGMQYAVYDQDGQTVKDTLKGFYVYSRNRVIWMKGLEGG